MGISVEYVHDVLGDAKLPAPRDALVEHARRKGADSILVGALEQLTPTEWGDLDELAEALQHLQPENRRPNEPPAPQSGEPPGNAYGQRGYGTEPRF